MATKSEMVSQFRDVIEQVVDGQAARAEEQHRSWPTVDTVAEASGLTFMKLGPQDGGLGMLALRGERKWAVTDNYAYHRRRIGTIALVSLESQPDNLLRHWSFESQMGSGLLSITSDRELTKAAELKAALDWIRSPHLNGEKIKLLGALSEEEDAKVKEDMRKDAKQAQELQQGLEQLSRTRSRSLHKPLDFRPRIR